MTAASKPTATAAAAVKTFPSVAQGAKPGLKDVADLIKDGTVKNVIIMAGAGISTSAGIPDFRSPETGLYANLEKYNLPYPEAVFDIDYLLENPRAFYTLAKELYPGNFKPTRTHYFFRMLRDKGVLKAVFTQNIDTLERMAGLEEELVIEAHGSFAEAACLECQKTYSKESIKPQIMRGEVVYCREERCKGNTGALVKPKIVFFGEGLPDRFFSRLKDFASADLLVVLGTSLTVQPFASLIHRVPTSCPRLLINLESVGEIEAPLPWLPSSMRSQQAAQLLNGGFDFDGLAERESGIGDVRWMGSSDEGVRELAAELGWAEELETLVEREWKKLDDLNAAETKAETDAETGSHAKPVEDDVKAPTAGERQEEVVEAVGKAAGVAKPSASEDADSLANGVDGLKLEEGDKEPASGEAVAVDESADGQKSPERKAPL